jgi:hypothetical protein
MEGEPSRPDADGARYAEGDVPRIDRRKGQTMKVQIGTVIDAERLTRADIGVEISAELLGHSRTFVSICVFPVGEPSIAYRSYGLLPAEAELLGRLFLSCAGVAYQGEPLP